MTPRRPYMLRAFYDWLVDNELTPHLVVEAILPGVRVPEGFVQDGRIILNIAPRCSWTTGWVTKAVTFARFSGRPHSVIVPLYAVQAIYARENGAGTMFEPEEAYMESFEEGIEESPFEEPEKGPSLSVCNGWTRSWPDSDPEPPRPAKGRQACFVLSNNVIYK